MSLVAYNSSDESQSSDDDTEKQPVRAQNDTQAQISDEDVTPAPTQTNNHNVDHVVTDRSIGDSQPHNNLSAAILLKGLPAPASRQLQAEEDELEDVVQPKVSQMSDAPKPPQKRTKQPARISIPAVQYSSDEDDDEPATKKKKTATGKSGLFSLLPEPVHAVKKESNRLLIPHTLSKKPPQKQDGIPASSQATPGLKKVPDVKTTTGPSSTAASVGASIPTAVTSTGSHKYSTQFQALTGYYSDSDEEENEGSSTNFFSFPSKEQPSSVSSESIPSVTSASVEKPISDTDTSVKDSVQSGEAESQVGHEQSETNNEPNKADDSCVTLTSMTSTSVTSSAMTLTSTDQDAPLDFQSSVDPNAPLSFKSSLNAPAAYGLAGPFRAKPGPAYYSMHETALSQEIPNVASGSYSQEPPNPNELNQEDVAQYLEDEQFLRLQGKRQRGKEEINIVEANMDDFVSSSNIELTKGLTEESQSISHRRNKDNNPTHTQKRKHQITYLAFQAKERELELKNTWAENRLTRRQTQAKYGF